MAIVDTKAEEYCIKHTDPEMPHLAEVNRDTHTNFLKPRMLSGHLQGRLLAVLSTLLKPKKILEIGTFTGYSALCLAEGLDEEGKLITLEADEELESTILKNVQKAGMESKVQLIMGNALDIIPDLDNDFDLVFIDADKLNYINYYKLVIEKVRLGGVILSDNVLWSGKVWDESKNDASTVLLREFNEYLTKDNRTKKVLLPFRDGLFISVKTR